MYVIATSKNEIFNRLLTNALFCTKDIHCKHSDKLFAWAADNFASLDMLFLSAIE